MVPAKIRMIKEDLNRDQYDHAIDQWILGRNAERDRHILRMYLFDGITYERMQRRLDQMSRELNAPKYGLSIDQIKKVVRKRKEELFKHI